MRSLTQLRKNQRADKTKSGRKAPRKFDLIQIHELNTEEQSEEIQLILDSSLPLLPKSTVDDAINAVVAQAEPEENATIDPIDVNVGVGQVDEKLWCVCNKPADGDMIGCDNSECKTEWFHFECVKIRKVPKGDWFCKDCRSGIKIEIKMHILCFYYFQFKFVYLCRVRTYIIKNYNFLCCYLCVQIFGSVWLYGSFYSIEQSSLLLAL